MKKLLFLSALLTGISICGYSQLTITSGAVFTIQAGATVTVQGDVTSNADIQGPGKLLLNGSTNQNINMNGFNIPNLELDNAANATLVSNARIGTNFNLVNGNLLVANENLVIAPTATITGNSSARFVVTGGTGVLTKEGLAASSFTYPVGFSTSEYNPVVIANTGTADNISVRCLQNVLDGGLAGAPVTANFANNSWVVTEAVAGGSNLAVTGEWVVGDELAGFNRLKSGVARYNSGTDWDLPASNVLAAAGAGPYTRNRSSIVDPGVFAVADLDQVNAARLSLKIFLQGPTFSTGLMSDGLRNLGLVPTTQPYSAALSATRFNRLGVFDGSASVNESVPATTVFDVAGTADDIVDWVYISLNDGTTPATKLQTRAALLQRDGDVVEYDALTSTYGPVKMPIDLDANYHLTISHRNHLAIRTPASQLLQDNTTFTYNFSTAQTQAFGTNPMASFGGVFGLRGGNVDYNNVTRASGPPSINDDTKLLNRLILTTNIFSGVYEPFDINMDGTTRASGPPAINDRSKLFSILGAITTILTEQL